MIKRISGKLRFRLLGLVILTFFLVCSLILSFAVPGYAAATVVRTLPSTVIPGETFDVTITFSAPENDFNAIGLTDFAPVGWGVAVNNTWNNPDSNLSNVSANKIEYIWYGPYNSGVPFTVVYHVTVPADTAPGTYYFTNPDPEPQLIYYIGGTGPTIVNITGSNSITVASYDLSVVASPLAGGTATDQTNASPYIAGATVNITAAANAGYRFNGWTATAGTFANAGAASTTFTMPSQAAIVTANFVPTYALTMAVSPGGTGTATDQTNASPYIAGATVNITAAASAGYRFNGWTSTAGSFANASAASTTFTMPAQAATVTANFVPTYVLTMAVSPGGTGTATDQTNASPYIAGATVNITAAANAGYHFVNWTSTAGSFANAGAASTTFTMPAQAVTITANFAISTYALSVVASPLAGGTATDQTNASPYIAGATVNITAAANAGYRFNGWTATAGTFANAGAASTTFTMPSQAAIVTANFVPTYALTMAVSPGGTGTATDQTNASPYIAGATVNITAVANAGYQFLNWTSTAGTFNNAGAASTTFTMPSQAATVTANFVYRAVIQGLTMDVKGTILGGVTLTLDGTTQAISAGDGTYQLIATTLGSHTVIASKAGYRSQTRTVVVTDPTISYNLDFKGDNGLVPNTLDISYVLACINKWQYPPADDTDLSMLKVLSVINAWKFPIN